MPTLMQRLVQLPQKRNIGRNVYNKTFTHNVHHYDIYNENPKCDKTQQCRRNVIHCTQKKHLNRQLAHSYYENPKCDNSQQLLRNVIQQIFRDANFYAVPSPCFLRNQIFAKFDNLIRDFSEIR